jgi:hypothetical protein
MRIGIQSWSGRLRNTSLCIWVWRKWRTRSETMRHCWTIWSNWRMVYVFQNSFHNNRADSHIDRTVLKDEILNILIAGRDTVGQIFSCRVALTDIFPDCSNFDIRNLSFVNQLPHSRSAPWRSTFQSRAICQANLWWHPRHEISQGSNQWWVFKV